MTHTATPFRVWISNTDSSANVSSGIDFVCVTGVGEQSRADADFIVKACNAHGDLVNAAKIALQYIEAVSFNSAGSKKSRNYAEAASIVRDALKEAGAA